MSARSMGLGALLLVLGWSAAALAANWQELLSTQLQQDQDCKVAFLSEVSERKSGAMTLISAKAHCEDGRSFLATRDNDLLPFKLELCQQPDARAC